MLHCTFCNKVFQGTQYQATIHFVQINYCKDGIDETLYEIARRSPEKFESGQMKRVGRYAAEHGLDVPRGRGASGGEARQHLVEGGGGGDGGQGASDRSLGGGGGDMEEDIIHIDHKARGPDEEGFSEHQDVPEFRLAIGERMLEWLRRAGKGQVPATEGLRHEPHKGADDDSYSVEEEVGHRATPADRGGLPRAEEEVTTAAAVEGEVVAAEEEVPAVATGEEEVPAGAAVEWEEAVQPVAVILDVVMEHEGADTTGGGDDVEEHLMQQFITEELDPVVGGLTSGMARGLGMSPTTGGAGSEKGTHFNFDMSMGAPPTCGGTASTDRAPSLDEVAGETGSQTPRERTTTESPDAARDIIERERVRLMASSNPRAQAFAWALEERRRKETGRDGGQGGVVAGAGVMEGVAAEEADEAVEGGPQAVDEVVEGGQGRDGGAGDARPAVHTKVMGPVVPFSGLHSAEARRSQPTEVAMYDVPPVIFTDLGSEPLVEPPCPQRPAPQEVDRPLDAEELAPTTTRHTPRKCGVPRPRLVPVEGGAALGESSRAEGLGMHRGSRGQDMVAQASTRVVLVRKEGGPVTIEENDPETAPTIQEEDEEYEGEEESEEESEAEESESHDNDDDDDDNEPPPPPPTRASTHPAAQIRESGNNGVSGSTVPVGNRGSGRSGGDGPQSSSENWMAGRTCFRYGDPDHFRNFCDDYQDAKRRGIPFVPPPQVRGGRMMATGQERRSLSADSTIRRGGSEIDSLMREYFLQKDQERRERVEREVREEAARNEEALRKEAELKRLEELAERRRYEDERDARRMRMVREEVLRGKEKDESGPAVKKVVKIVRTNERGETLEEEKEQLRWMITTAEADEEESEDDELLRLRRRAAGLSLNEKRKRGKEMAVGDNPPMVTPTKGNIQACPMEQNHKLVRSAMTKGQELDARLTSSNLFGRSRCHSSM
ncbi:hypothetical protein CBR_g37892 [Chara braunii]|uniref:Uncharacterized protein n=1 Tax=Chara braunii TaxID=69332 RepID=A0A388LNW6_CHABU|nr:hypothetical protein CBR_g37892 [Chara braunii]|eukprot:GBG84017.1 hypothetical protein CBR_g37892 [Chara braunii]